MKPRLLVCGALAAVVFAVGLAVWLTGGNHPFESLECAQVQAVQVRLIPPSVQYELNEEEIEEFCGLLRSVVSYRIFSPEMMSGQFVEFTLFFQDGSSHTVQPFGDLITIDGETFQAAYDPNEALNHFANQHIPA